MHQSLFLTSRKITWTRIGRHAFFDEGVGDGVRNALLLVTGPAFPQLDFDNWHEK